MTELKIIARLWSHITDLRMILNGHSMKTIEQIEAEIDVTEYNCRRYADADDAEEIWEEGGKNDNRRNYYCCCRRRRNPLPDDDGCAGVEDTD